MEYEKPEIVCLDAYEIYGDVLDCWVGSAAIDNCMNGNVADACDMGLVG